MLGALLRVAVGLGVIKIAYETGRMKGKAESLGKTMTECVEELKRETAEKLARASEKFGERAQKHADTMQQMREEGIKDSQQ